MKIKFTALVLALMMLFNISALAAFSDVDSGTRVGNAVVQLSQLGILNGFGDGSFRPDDTLTRAQFAKIAVCMLGEEKTAASRTTNAVFSDVASGHWASGYINYIAEKEIINGYPDGTFGAEDTITYAQALTILIRLLGYNGEDVGYKWPEGYITKAKSLGITEGMTFDTYESITRGNAAYVIYNTLLADKKEGSQVKLLSSSSVDDVVIYGDSEIDASLASGNITTTRGSYKLADNSNITSSVYGRLGTLYLDSENRATAFVPENETVRSIIVSGAALNSDGNKVEITFSEGSLVKTESFSGSAPLYYDGKTSGLGSGIAQMEAGREALLFYTESGSFARMYLKESSLAGPVTIISGYSQIYSSFNIVNSNTMTVIRDGRNASLSDISMYDVVYYMAGNNTLYAYTDKISGTYEEAYPLKANVSSVKIAGREYTLSTRKAINKMNTSAGAFEIGERVTLLLGRNGEVVDVVDLAASGSLDLAVLTKCYSEISDDVENQGKTAHYANVVIGDGTEVTYEVEEDYSDYVGNVVKVEYKDTFAKLTKVKHSNIYGAYDSSVPSLNGHWISKNCTILELVKQTSSEATVKKIELSDIQTTRLGTDQVLHVETSGNMKDITFMYVTDVTMSDADFGVVVDTEKAKGEVASYTVMFDNSNVKKIQTVAYGWSNGAAIHIKETSEGTEYLTLLKVGEGAAVDGYTAGRARINNETYIISDYVRVYGGKDASNFESMSMSEIVNNDNVQRVTLYSDRPLSQGGIVRVIVVKTNK